MNGRILQVGRSTRTIAWMTLTVLMMLMVGLAGCGKDQQDTDIDLGTDLPGVPEEAVDVPESDIPVVDETPKPAEVKVPPLDLKPAFFDFDKYGLTSDAQAALNHNGRLLKEYPTVRVLIEGHCDERGTVQYNLALGEKRARAARDYLADLGIAKDRMEIVSYGKERPFKTGHNEKAWAENRRAHFVQR